MKMKMKRGRTTISHYRKTEEKIFLSRLLSSSLQTQILVLVLVLVRMKLYVEYVWIMFLPQTRTHLIVNIGSVGTAGEGICDRHSVAQEGAGFYPFVLHQNVK